MIIVLSKVTVWFKKGSLSTVYLLRMPTTRPPSSLSFFKLSTWDIMGLTVLALLWSSDFSSFLCFPVEILTPSAFKSLCSPDLNSLRSVTKSDRWSVYLRIEKITFKQNCVLKLPKMKVGHLKCIKLELVATAVKQNSKSELTFSCEIQMHCEI